MEHKVKGFEGLADLLQQQDDARQAKRMQSKKRRSHEQGVQVHYASSSQGTESSISKEVSCATRPGKFFLAGVWTWFCARWAG